MNNIIKIISIIIFAFVPLKAGDEYKIVSGLWDIKIYDGQWCLYEMVDKSCYLKVTEDGSMFIFSSNKITGYSIVARLKKEKEQ